MTFFCFDLGELPDIRSASPLFGHNESRPLQFRDRDYLRGHDQPVGEQLDEFLPPAEKGERTCLVSSPRYFGYAFNPVNFYLRLRGDALIAALAEVNNTFGDRHIYPLPKLRQEADHYWTAECPKDFHVSPFNNMEGDYHFSFRVERRPPLSQRGPAPRGELRHKDLDTGPRRAADHRSDRPPHPASPLRHRAQQYAAHRLAGRPAALSKKDARSSIAPARSSKHTLIDRDETEEDRPVI